MEILYQIKRELLNEWIRERMPVTVQSKKPLNWWIDQKFATIEDLEIVEE